MKHILVKIYNFGSNLKMSHYGQKWPLDLLVRELLIKKCGLWGLKRDIYTHTK